MLERGWTVEQLQEFEQTLLGDDLRRLMMACAEVRQRLLDFILEEDVLRKAALELEAKVSPIVRFLSEAALPAGAVQYAAQREAALLYRSLARGWREIRRVDEQIACLELACRWAPLDLREEILPDLEHLRVLQAPQPDVRHAHTVMTLAPRFGGVALLGLLIVACLVGLYWVTPRPKTMNLPRQAIQKRIDAILKENAELVGRIAWLEKEKNRIQGKGGTRSAEELDRLRERNDKLLIELDQLEKARRGGI